MIEINIELFRKARISASLHRPIDTVVLRKRRSNRASARYVSAVLLALPAHCLAQSAPAPHGDPIAPVILGVTGILFFAVLGRFAARKLGQPSVLGELIMGIILGNLGYYFGAELIMLLREGPAIFDVVELTFAGEPLQTAATSVLGTSAAPEIVAIVQGPFGLQLFEIVHTVDVFSRYGVIFLLFLVGLDTSVEEMGQVGAESSRVAVLGVVLPAVLGFEAARFLMPELSVNTDLFVAATLGATSVGITARVLQDLGKGRSHEAHVVLGAAVIDDILGLVALAIVSGIVVSGGLDIGSALTIIVAALMFLTGAIVLSPYFLNYVIKLVRHLDLVEAKMFISFLFVMVLAWLANLVGLATIVGAFTAGLILHDAYFRHWGDTAEHPYSIKDLIMPLEVILVPIFFVLMGIQVKLEAFADWRVIGVAAGLLLAAVIGKLASGLGAAKSTNRLAVGFGMMPRGEVGLIFAAIGKNLGVINDALFSALVLTIILTTLAAPPFLKIALKRSAREASQSPTVKP